MEDEVESETESISQDSEKEQASQGLGEAGQARPKLLARGAAVDEVVLKERPDAQSDENDIRSYLRKRAAETDSKGKESPEFYQFPVVYDIESTQSNLQDLWGKDGWPEEPPAPVVEGLDFGEERPIFRETQFESPLLSPGASDILSELINRRKAQTDSSESDDSDDGGLGLEEPSQSRMTLDESLRKLNSFDMSFLEDEKKEEVSELKAEPLRVAPFVPPESMRVEPFVAEPIVAKPFAEATQPFVAKPIAPQPFAESKVSQPFPETRAAQPFVAKESFAPETKAAQPFVAKEPFAPAEPIPPQPFVAKEPFAPAESIPPQPFVAKEPFAPAEPIPSQPFVAKESFASAEPVPPQPFVAKEPFIQAEPVPPQPFVPETKATEQFVPEPIAQPFTKEGVWTAFPREGADVKNAQALADAALSASGGDPEPIVRPIAGMKSLLSRMEEDLKSGVAIDTTSYIRGVLDAYDSLASGKTDVELSLGPVEPKPEPQEVPVARRTPSVPKVDVVDPRMVQPRPYTEPGERSASGPKKSNSGPELRYSLKRPNLAEVSEFRELQARPIAALSELRSTPKPDTVPARTSEFSESQINDPIAQMYGLNFLNKMNNRVSLPRPTRVGTVSSDGIIEDAEAFLFSDSYEDGRMPKSPNVSKAKPQLRGDTA
jgi:hypothetical protein